MQDSDLIGGDILTAIVTALKMQAPDLQHHILTILRNEPATSGPVARGQSIYHQFPVKMRAEDAAAILAALKKVEASHGYDKLFEGRQINFLVNQWMQQVDRLRAGKI